MVSRGESKGFVSTRRTVNRQPSTVNRLTIFLPIDKRDSAKPFPKICVQKCAIMVTKLEDNLVTG